jgi:hypothetical protein
MTLGTCSYWQKRLDSLHVEVIGSILVSIHTISYKRTLHSPQTGFAFADMGNIDLVNKHMSKRDDSAYGDPGGVGGAPEPSVGPYVKQAQERPSAVLKLLAHVDAAEGNLRVGPEKVCSRASRRIIVGFVATWQDTAHQVLKQSIR